MTDQRATRRRLLTQAPDTPLYVETRAMLLDGHARVAADSGGAVLVDPECALVAIHRRPAVTLVERAVAAAKPGWDAIAPEVEGAAAALAEISRALPAWHEETAIIHTLERAERPPAPASGSEADVRPLRASADLSHVPHELRGELELALQRDRAVFATWVDGAPVSFCVAFHLTESFWDVSIDTLAPYRRRGLAAATARRMIELQRAGGREPVWGAVESNRASRELARRLGFVPCGRLRLWTCPGSG